MVKFRTVLESWNKIGKSAFRTSEMAKLVGNSAYSRVLLHRLKKKGKIALVRRGIWAFSDAIPQVVACEISKPAFLSFFSALYIHGLTTQIPIVIQLAVVRNATRYNIFDQRVQEYKVRSDFFNNFQEVDGILLASKEKAFADSLMIHRSCPLGVLVEALGIGIDI